MPITYNYAAIREVAASIGKFTTGMEQDLDTLYGQFRQLFSQDWGGQAGQAVDAAQQKWNQGAQEIEQVLANVGVKLEQAAERMQARDQQIANEIHT